MAKKQRFPRIRITSEIRLVERILHHTYNKLAGAKDINKAGYHKYQYDIYKTKFGRRAPVIFLMLAQTLVEEGIDPAVYIKVLSRYGRFGHSNYMPHPTWLGSKKALEVFSWMYQSRKKRYEREKDWRNYLDDRNLSAKHIRKEIRYEARRIKHIRRTHRLDLLPAILMILFELNSWYLGAAMLLTSRKVRESLWVVLESLPKDEQKRIRLTAQFLANSGNTGRWVARKTKKYFK
jgi:hypothetical protein